MKDFCNNIYKDLAARLGEIQIQLDVLENEKKTLLSHIHFLNKLSPQLQSAQSELAANKQIISTKE